MTDGWNTHGHILEVRGDGTIRYGGQVPSRTYTVAEVDEMRGYVRSMLSPPSLTPYDPEELDRTVEERLRTYLVAGVSVSDLKEATGGAWQSERIQPSLQWEIGVIGGGTKERHNQRDS